MERHVPSAADGRRALRDHLIDKAREARSRHGPVLDADGVRRLLADHAVVRYPVTIEFGAERLEPGEFAYAEQVGGHPSEGFRLWLRPCFETMPGAWPALVAYHLPPINYGEIATSEDCEAFGAALLGMDEETYYRTVCALADSMPE